MDLMLEMLVINLVVDVSSSSLAVQFSMLQKQYNWKEHFMLQECGVGPVASSYRVMYSGKKSDRCFQCNKQQDNARPSSKFTDWILDYWTCNLMNFLRQSSNER